MLSGLTTVHEERMASLVDFSSAYKVGVTFSGVPARPSYAISREHLLFC